MKKQYAEISSESETSSKASIARKIGVRAIGMVMGMTIGLVPGTALAGAYLKVARPVYAADLLHAATTDPTSTERTIQNAAEKALDVDVRVRCAPVPQENEEHQTYGMTNMFRGGNLAVIRMQEARCAEFMTIVSRQELLPEGEVKAAARGLYTVTHEYTHADEGLLDEALTDCYTFQNSYNVAIGAGTSTEVANQLARTIAVERPKTAPDEYRTSAECVPDGTLDLGVAPPEHFPVVS